MPDFAERRPKKERPIHKVGETKASKANRGERPAAVLKRLLGDFRSGIRALHEMLARKEASIRTVETSSVDAARRESSQVGLPESARLGSSVTPGVTGLQSATVPKPESVRAAETSAKPLFGKAERRSKQVVPGRRRLPGELKPVRMTREPDHAPEALKRLVDQAIRTVPAGMETAKVAHPRPERWGDIKHYLPVTGADREAYHQMSQPFKEGDPRHLPSDARLAQILRADSLSRTGELRANPQVATWAKAIREGRRREIADINPLYVQKVLHEMTGGATKAQQLLHTTLVARLIEQHRVALETMRAGLESKRVARSKTRRGETAPSTVPTGYKIAPSGMEAPVGTVGMASPPAGLSSVRGEHSLSSGSDVEREYRSVERPGSSRHEAAIEGPGYSRHESLAGESDSSRQEQAVGSSDSSRQEQAAGGTSFQQQDQLGVEGAKGEREISAVTSTSSTRQTADSTSADFPGTRKGHARGLSRRNESPATVPNPEREEAELLNMLMTNEVPHMVMASEAMGREEQGAPQAAEAQAVHQETGRAKSRRGARSERPVSKELTRGEGGEESPPQARHRMHDLSAAPPRSTMTAMSPPPVNGGGGKKQQNYELTGKLTIPGLNRQAELTGTMMSHG